MFTHATCSTTSRWVTVRKLAISLNKVELVRVAVISACTCAQASNVSSAVAVGHRPSGSRSTSRLSMLGSALKQTTS